VKNRPSKTMFFVKARPKAEPLRRGEGEWRGSARGAKGFDETHTAWTRAINHKPGKQWQQWKRKCKTPHEKIIKKRPDGENPNHPMGGGKTLQGKKP